MSHVYETRCNDVTRFLTREVDYTLHKCIKCKIACFSGNKNIYIFGIFIKLSNIRNKTD